MTNALSIQTIFENFNEDTEMWILIDKNNFPYKYLTVPQNDGRKFHRFFMKKEDAQDFLQEVLDVNAKLTGKNIFPSKVNLFHTVSLILMTDMPYFSVHSPNEVFEYVSKNMKS